MTEWTKRKYNEYYTSYVPWLEDKYLQWFGENKISYTAKDKLKATKITGDKNIDAIQDGVAEGVGGQFAKGGLLGGVGEISSKEGVNRAERWDTGPISQQGTKGWGETLTGGILGGGGGGGEKK